MFQGKFVNLRALEKEDLEILRDWRNMKHVRKSTREYRLLNMINQKNWFESIQNDNPPKNIMFGIVNKKRKLVGVTGLTYIDWKNRTSEISIYLSSINWQKKSEAQDVINLIMEYGFGELNLNRLWVEIYGLMNENIKLFEKMKFFKEGILREKVWRNKKWWDTYIYSKLASEYYEEKH
jgi:RimJ/RimL family protein N-acetyltransferase